MKYDNDWKQGSTKKLQDTRGAIAVIVALLMVVLIGAVALAVDTLFLLRHQSGSEGGSGGYY